MNIGFVVNQFRKETPEYTTSGLALQASKMGHQVYYISVGDFSYTQDELMGAMARKLPEKSFRNSGTLLEALKQVEKTAITSQDLDIMLLRNDPAAEMGKRPWAQNAGIVFGQLAKQQNVLVLNDPHALSLASNKMYFQYFPKEVRPATIITRNVADITHFFNDNNKKIILKPLQGSGGKNVFMIENKDVKNLNQIVEAISRDGFVVAQEYLPAAKDGDIRVFLVDGEPIIVDGQMAAIHRHQKEGDIRSNIHAGGHASKAKITKKIKEIIAQVSQKLKDDGMFLCGLDVVGDKLMEVNVFSPGGLYHACKLHNVDFYASVIKTIEKKIYG